jgi:hypothetical protein
MLREGKEPFIVRGAHATVYPCTLPLWLPSEIVDQMVQVFWEKLRKRLVDLCGNTGGLRARAQSSGSDRFSPTPNEEEQLQSSDGLAELFSRLGIVDDEGY